MNQRKLLITADGSHTIFLPEINETYHSTHGAIQESQHVFINQGLTYYVEQNACKAIDLFEVGFGTGLNAILAVQYIESKNVSINYTAVEAFPLTNDEVDSLNYPKLLGVKSAKETFEKIQKCGWGGWNNINANFRLIKVKAVIQEFDVPLSDICFFDAFAPSKQPEMWERSILEKMYNALNPGGILVTYCAKGQFKRDLKSIGFEVETLDGPPGKKEMVRAIKT